MNKLAELVISWALQIAVGNQRDKIADRVTGYWPTPKRVAVVAGAAVALEFVVAFVERAFAKKTSKPVKIPVSV